MCEAGTGPIFLLPQPIYLEPARSEQRLQLTPPLQMQVALQPSTELGPTVISDVTRGMRGRVQPIR